MQQLLPRSDIGSDARNGFPSPPHLIMLHSSPPQSLLGQQLGCHIRFHSPFMRPTHTHRSFNKSYASMSIFPAAVLTFCLISLCFIVLPAYAADKAGVEVRCEEKRATTVCLSLTLRSRPSSSFWPEQLSELSPIHCEQFRMRYFAAAVGLVIVIPKLSISIYSTYLKSVRHFDSHPIS